MKKFLLLTTIFIGSLACAKTESKLSVVPMPQEVSFQKGSFNIKGASFNYTPGLEKRTTDAIIKFADNLYACTEKLNSVAVANGVNASTPIGNLKGVFFVKDDSMPAEHYNIEIAPKALKITASDHNGFFYAIQTLRQMLPISNYAGKYQSGDKWKLPCVKINDYPRFGYRGMHLDCCRHFFSIDEVKKYLDIMAMYKMNRFHWHLTEDQGWRMEIKAFPELTEVGAYRNGTMIGRDFNSNDGIRYGGYYTQEQMKEIVDYAWTLGITVIPEIDLPGHMVAALTAYPYLGCTGGPYEVWSKWGVSEEVLCVGKESTFDFLEKVLDEMCEIFPSEYIHIGGDECPKTRWESCPVCQAKIKELGLVSDDKGTKEQKLQNYVTSRIQKYLEAKGRKIIGWDEILEGELEPGATIMSWRGAKGGIAAAKRGMDAIMTPNSHFYFDYMQSQDKEKEPVGIGGDLPLEKVYSFQPFDGLNADEQKHILGVQANLWTEYIATPEHLEYMLLPRMLALTESQWNPDAKDFDRFTDDLKAHQEPIFKILGYNYREYTK